MAIVSKTVIHTYAHSVALLFHRLCRLTTTSQRWPKLNKTINKHIILRSKNLLFHFARNTHAHQTHIHTHTHIHMEKNHFMPTCKLLSLELMHSHTSTLCIHSAWHRGQIYSAKEKSVDLKWNESGRTPAHKRTHIGLTWVISVFGMFLIFNFSTELY